MPSKVRVRLKEHSYIEATANIEATAKAGDIVDAPIEAAQDLFKRGLAEPPSEGERRFFTFVNQICNDLEQQG